MPDYANLLRADARLYTPRCDTTVVHEAQAVGTSRIHFHNFNHPTAFFLVPQLWWRSEGPPLARPELQTGSGRGQDAAGERALGPRANNGDAAESVSRIFNRRNFLHLVNSSGTIPIPQ